MAWCKLTLTPNSSNVFGIGYDEKTKEIMVLFKKGMDTYFYQNCSIEEWKRFKEAKSKGKYVHSVLKKKKFRKESLQKR